MKTESIAAEVIALLKQKRLTLATAESCTGGGIGFQITSIPGSSSVYLGGVVSYANDVKERVLGVSDEVLKTFGAVSCQTAEAMAVGVKALVNADISVSVTGIAGPASDDTNKPVGLVFIGVASDKGVVVRENLFFGNRENIRQQSIETALKLVCEVLLQA